MSQHADTLDLADIVRALNRGRIALLTCLLIGTALAIAVLLWAPRKFTSSSSIIIRPSSGESSLLSQLTGQGGIGAILNPAQSSLETEISILDSRAVADRVIDSLELQLRVRSPAGIPATALVSRADLPGSFEPRRYAFDRGPNGYTISGAPSATATAAGAPVKLPVGTIALRADTTLPSHFELQVFDREDAAKRFAKALSVAKGGGDVVRVSYQADDSLTAARVPNAITAVYLERRHTSDRGVNEHRVEFLVPRVDSAGRQLADAEAALRREQERTGDIDPKIVGQLGLTTLGDVRSKLFEVDLERGALDSLLGRVEQHQIGEREIAAFPTFIKSTAITQLLAQLSTLDAERLKLLATRTPADPQVQAVTQSIASVQGQLVPIAQSYAAALSTQRKGLQRQLDSLSGALTTLPRDLEASTALQSEILRRNQVYAALQAQLVQARLAAISEGGDVHQLDVATPPKRPSFPEPVTTLGLGIGGGLAVGAALALLLSAVGRWARDPFEVERLAGVPAMRLDAGAPLLIGGRAARTVLILPLDAAARTERVAEQMVETAVARAATATVLDLTAPCANPNETIARLEQEFSYVVVRLPELSSKTTIGALRDDRPVLLVAPPGRVHKAQLHAVMGALRRLEVPCAGVVMTPPPNGRVLARV